MPAIRPTLATMRARDVYSKRREAELRYPHRVDVPVSVGGLGRRLDDMHAWCREHVGAGGWEQHADRKRRPGATPIDYARFYFADAEQAEAFRRRWL